MEGSAGEFPGLAAALIERNLNPLRLHSLKKSLPIKLWNITPETRPYFTLSLPAYDEQHRTALCFGYINYGGLAASGDLFLLTKDQEGTWKVEALQNHILE